jgi:hypothetical protein
MSEVSDRRVVGAIRGSLFFVYSEGDGPCVFLGIYRSLDEVLLGLTHAHEQSGVRVLEDWRRRAGLQEPWYAAIFEVAWGVLALHASVRHWSSLQGLLPEGNDKPV